MIISYEEKHGVDDEISLSSDENNIARPPRRCDVYHQGSVGKLEQNHQ